MWYQDIQQKKLKEDEKMYQAKQRNLQVSSVLQEQMKVLEAQKMEEKRIKNENAKLIVSLQRFGYFILNISI